MNYNPKTHLLRPLEPGEIIEDGDLIASREGLIDSVSIGIKHKPDKHLSRFRPVPITTGWRPRSEAHMLRSFPLKSKVLWRNVDSMYGDALFDASVETGESWNAFLIIPPCDLPQPDPERERFEKWWRTSHTSVANKADALIVWLAARKETK